MAKELLTDGTAVVGGLYVKHGLALRELTETFLASAFTDGHPGTTGTITFAGEIPQGAIVVGGKVLVNAGMVGVGNNACTIQVGDGTIVDRYNAGTPSIYAVAADGIGLGVPTGPNFHPIHKHPVVTATVNVDFTTVLVGGGSITVSIYFITTLAG